MIITLQVLIYLRSGRSALPQHGFISQLPQQVIQQYVSSKTTVAPCRAQRTHFYTDSFSECPECRMCHVPSFFEQARSSTCWHAADWAENSAATCCMGLCR